MIPAKATIIELDMDKLEEILRRLEAKELDADDYETIKAVIGAYVYLVNVVGDKDTTIRRLRQMLFGVKTEKTSAVLGRWKGDVVHNDDTGVKILELMAERARQAALEDNDNDAADHAADVVQLAEDAAEDSREESGQELGPDRTGTFTTGIVATRDGQKIALFLSGPKPAGEDLKDVLRRRAGELPAPIQMCDALSRNLPGKLKTIVANCLAHGRRQFVDVADAFPEECQHVLESLSVVYHNDAIARERNLSPQGRLLFHQTESGPTMEELHIWLGRQFDERRVEPNSALGEAISYLLRHWEKLTLFLRVPGSPLDNNICERAPKQIALGRKNWLFVGSVAGGQQAATLMTIVSSAIRNDLEVAVYLKDVLDQLLSGSTDYAALCPHVWKLAHPEAIRTYRVEERRNAADRKRVRRARRRLQRR